MARGRLISKSLSTSEKYAALHEADPALAEFCQSLFPLLVAHADDFGRLPGDPFSVRLSIMPTSPRLITDFGSALMLLEQVGLILRYEVGGRKYVQILKFDEHQTGLHKRTRSHFPAPPMDSGKSPDNPSEQEQEREQEENRNGKKRSPIARAVPGGFEVFWEVYPKKVAKEAARAIWDRLAPDSDLLTRMLAAVRSQQSSDQWQRERGKFIPHPRTWLYQQRWNDEVETSAPRPTSCRRGHQPPCADETICSRRYLAELNTPIEAKA